MHRTLLTILPLLFLFFDCFAQQDTIKNYYWVQFSDKAGTIYSIDKPEEFLSQKAIERRDNQNIKIDETDLPVSKTYTDSITNRGIRIVHTSKWLNGATIEATQLEVEDISASFSFISETQLTKPGQLLKSANNKFEIEQTISEIDSAFYGLSRYQIGQLNGQFLHNQGFLGQGMHIAVLDAGFLMVDELPAFYELIGENRIVEIKDFVDPNSDFFQTHRHGMNVLSTMAGYIPNNLIGSAHEANYSLFRSEDSGSEYQIEADNWVVAAEYADSIGADIINSSLGYTLFEDPNMNYTYEDLDGKTTRVTRGANMAFQKGMLIFSSAGNEGNKGWKYLVAPSDGDYVIGVGAVDRDGAPAPFSSFGPASDGDVKPNVSAMGWGTFLQRQDGNVGAGNGTSFSSPVLAGMAACLWQAFPRAKNADIKNAIEKSASLYETPDNQLGYGIPDFEKASILLTDWGLGNLETTDFWRPEHNPFSNRIQFNPLRGIENAETRVILIGINGNVVVDKYFASGNPLVLTNLSTLPQGIYIAYIETEINKEVHKLVKIHAN